MGRRARHRPLEHDLKAIDRLGITRLELGIGRRKAGETNQLSVAVEKRAKRSHWVRCLTIK